MSTVANIIRGKKAQSRGDIFETLIQRSAAQLNWHVVRIPMGAKMVSQYKMIRVKTDFDFVLIKEGNIVTEDGRPAIIFADTKTTLGKTFAKSECVPHQIDSLLKIHKRHCISGYIVNFTVLQKTVFYTAEQLSNLKPRQSLSPENGLIVGDNIRINLDKIIIMTQGDTTQSKTTQCQ